MIDNSATVDFVLRRARGTIVNILPMAALTKGMRGEEMTEIGRGKPQARWPSPTATTASPTRR